MTTAQSGKPEADAATPPSVARGAAVIARSLRTLTGSAGIYRMNGADGKPLYIGKARNLKRRVAAYTRPERMPTRLQRMIAATQGVEVITTHTEVEALLLESNLIKRLKPRYNVMLRDDKSFPYILLTGDHRWPQLLKHRGARNRKGEFFGPFASAGAVNRTLAALQRAFPLRSCSDAVFAARTRPCLQHQIKRCTAPCVGRIEAEDYAAIVQEIREFLTGRSHHMQQHLADRMQQASDQLEFESAAIYRDRIRALTQIQAHQDINVAGLDDADVIAAHQTAGQTCVQVFFFRAGQNFGNCTFFPRHAAELGVVEVLGPFLGQFYADKEPPRQVLVSHLPENSDLVAAALAVRAGRRVVLARPARGTKRKLVDHALANAREAMARRLSESAAQRRLLEGLAETFALDGAPRRIEVYDNSHVSGTNAVGAMIVAGPDGLVKNAYRKFNIKSTDMAPGDDYAMMREVLGRRFRRALHEDPGRESETWPDLVLIDGGSGHLGAAGEVMAELGIDDVPLAAISKGPDRNAGREQFHLPGRRPFILPPSNPVLYFLQRLRDEAHRFAIGSHRARRSKAITRSVLDEIAGVGAVRKRALLHHFGSARAVQGAGLADLEAVDGINRGVAKKIYDHFHADG
jgi:excinuclease ABC subunit C